MNKYTEPCQICGQPITGLTQYKRKTGHTCYTCKKKRHNAHSLANARKNRDKINFERREARRLSKIHHE